jgi:3-dehydroquinate synthetase
MNSITKVDVAFGQNCPYYLGDQILSRFPDYLNHFSYDSVFLVSSAVPFQLFGDAFLTTLREQGIPATSILIDDREVSKNWQTLSILCERLLEAGATRDSLVIALGGGVVSNIAGLAAGLVFRGIRYVDVPTTLMAQTDGALSAKQAINGHTGKNQFGLYHSPIFIWSDVAYSRREPWRQTRSAIVEAIKNGLVNSAEWIDDLSLTLRNGMDGVYANYESFILRIVRSKLEILQSDSTEKQKALVLEYGHTAGHALEWLSRGDLLHGEAVAIGMCVAAQLSFAMHYMSKETLQLHYHLLRDLLGVPVCLPEGLSPEQIYRTTLNDNKRTGRGLAFLLLEEPGRMCREDGSYLIRTTRESVLDALAATSARVVYA